MVSVLCASGAIGLSLKFATVFVGTSARLSVAVSVKAAPSLTVNWASAGVQIAWLTGITSTVQEGGRSKVSTASSTVSLLPALALYRSF